MKKILLATLFLCLALWAYADPIEFNTAGITMDVPDGWIYEINEASDQILITSPDSLIVMVFMPLPTEGLEDDTDKIVAVAMETAINTVMESSPDAEFDDPEEMDFHGIPAVILDGDGSLQGVNVEISLIVLIGEVPVMGIAYLLPGSAEYSDALEYFVESIAPL